MLKKNILVVDDSALMRRIICDIINSDARFQAKDVCKDGVEAYQRLRTHSYDAVVMDINMPRMDGLELLKKLQEENIRVTVIVVSSLTTKDAQTTILAMERGAVDFVTKPNNLPAAKGEDFKQALVNVLEAVLHMDSPGQKQSAGVPVRVPGVRKKTAGIHGGKKLIALACSTGGPKSLQSVIPFLKRGMNAPMVLVQHMPAGFTKSMAERLNEISEVTVKEAEEGDILQPGRVYVAPGGKHMEIAKTAAGHKIVLTDKPPVGGLKPYANYMYQSLVNSGFDEILCVVLTGMGMDGTKGIAELSKHKPVHVICQDQESCVVYGMPKAAAEAGLADEILPLTEVAQSIMKNVGVR